MIEVGPCAPHVPHRRSERRNGAGPRGMRRNEKTERSRGDEGKRRVLLRVVHPPSRPFKSLFPLHLTPGFGRASFFSLSPSLACLRPRADPAALRPPAARRRQLRTYLLTMSGSRRERIHEGPATTGAAGPGWSEPARYYLTGACGAAAGAATGAVLSRRFPPNVPPISKAQKAVASFVSTAGEPTVWVTSTRSPPSSWV
jgi:hypothetical protein